MEKKDVRTVRKGIAIALFIVGGLGAAAATLFIVAFPPPEDQLGKGIQNTVTTFLIFGALVCLGVAALGFVVWPARPAATAGSNTARVHEPTDAESSASPTSAAHQPRITKTRGQMK